MPLISARVCIQCFQTVDWSSGRESRLLTRYVASWPILNADFVLNKSLNVSWALNTGWTCAEYIVLEEARPRMQIGFYGLRTNDFGNLCTACYLLSKIDGYMLPSVC